MLTQYFKETLPNKPYCSDNLNFGLKIRTKKHAVNSLHVQFNQPALAHWLAFDIDSETAGMDWHDNNGPAPNFVIQNPENGHAHYLFGLESPICVSPKGRMAPVRFLAGVESGLTARLGGDLGYSGLIAKNPLKDTFWRVWQPRQELYTLDELADFCDPANATHTSTREIRSFGRNVETFDRLRFWAYEHVQEARETGSFDTWANQCLAMAESFNSFTTPLGFNEIKATAKSVAKWTWTHYRGQFDGKNRGVLGYGVTRHDTMEATHLAPDEIKQRQKAGATYATTAKQARTEAKIKEAIAKLRLDGKRPTVASVARLAGVHRNTISTKYKHLLA